MRLLLFCILGCFGLAGAPQCLAQAGAPVPAPPVPAGTVTGHVYIGGANTPARLVNINLQSIDVPEDHARNGMPGVPGKLLPVRVFQTDLNGGYVIGNVPAGVYYVVVSMPGFLSPFSAFTLEELQHPTTQQAHEIAATLPVVRVQPGSTTTHDIVMEQGASLAGTVRFDDGTPFYNAPVFVQRRGSDGKWVAQHSYSARPAVDMQGRWEISGLLPGEYRVHVKLELNERRQSSGLLQNSSSSSFTQYDIDYYLGDTAQASAAKTVTLEADERNTGEDVTVPVSRLHSLSGAVVDAGSGQPINSARVSLLFPDTGATLVSVSVDATTRTFTFPYVPEGAYTLRVENAREARFDATSAAEGDPNFPDRNRREVIVRRYVGTEMPLTFTTDTTGLSLAVAPMPAHPQP